jgi:large subunit ribosomal protein L2
MIRRKKHGGRTNSGRITVWHRGGESKRFLRPLDLTRDQACTGIVEAISYDPNRSARIALVRVENTDKLTPKQHITPPVQTKLQTSTVTWSSILAWEGIQINDTVINTASSATTKLVSGLCAPLSIMPLGTTVHNIEAYPGQGGQYIRASGTSGQILLRDESRVQVRLPSGVVKTFQGQCRASVGVVQHTNRESVLVTKQSNTSHLRFKAGCQRWRGRRPHVRGVAMNPIDHPHGGRSRGRSVSPWGLKQGVKTRRAK